MIQRLNVARRATLGKSMSSKFAIVIEQLTTGRSAYELIIARCGLDSKQMAFHKATYLMGLVSYFEGFISDITIELLTAFPGKLTDKAFKLDAFARAGSIGNLIEESAYKSIYEIAYKPFPEMIQAMLTFFGRDTIDGALVDRVNEIKCTRDIYTHANGKVNETYVRKAGTYSRAKIGGTLPLDDAYIEAAYNDIQQFTQAFYAAGPKKYEGYNRSKALEEMWDFTCLSKFVPFEEAWTKSETEDMVRPAKEFNHWSSSEKALYDFFLRIYSTKYPAISTEWIYAFERWPSDTPEGQVMLSWLDSPFHF